MRGLVRLVSALLLTLTGMEASAQREITFAPYALPASGTIALAVRQDVPQEGVFAEVDAAVGGALRRAVTAMNYRGERDKLLELAGIGSYERIIVIGTGVDAPAARVFEDVGGWAGQVAARSPAKRVEILWSGAEAEAGAHLAFGAALGQYRFTKYRQNPPGAPVLGEGEIVVRTPAGAAAGSTYLAQWRPVADAVRYARDLITEPANEIYPESFVERTRQAFRGIANVRIDVLDVPAMEKLGMGGMLSVGKGSTRPPRLLVVRYDGGKSGETPFAFVGKGITFDSGGVSIKPNDGMWRMKTDMSGAATVTGTVLALAGRKAPVNAVAIAALAENMPDGSASRPGDVVRTMSGRTFEIMSTDAEGRMVLSDAVWYAQQQFKPRVVIDVATLTGAIITALGDDYAGLFSRDDKLAAQLLSAGQQAGELLWRMPLHASYAKDLESPIADIRNSAGRSLGGGAGHGAHFIGAWIENGTPWAHIDIAGMTWREAEGLPTSPPGAAGFGIRALDRYVRMTTTQ
jgi:leucyl aminopeptidase